MKRRIVSVLMALVMALSLLPVQALAEDAAVGEPVTEIKQAEQIGEGKEPGDPEEQTGEGEEPGDPEEEQEPGEPEEPVREFVQGEAQLPERERCPANLTRSGMPVVPSRCRTTLTTAVPCRWAQPYHRPERLCAENERH